MDNLNTKSFLDRVFQTSLKNFLKEILNQNKNRTLLENILKENKRLQKTQTLLNVYA